MVIRVNIKTGTAIPLDDAVENRGAELTEIVKERLALLKVADALDIVENVGIRFDDDTYIIHEV